MIARLQAWLAAIGLALALALGAWLKGRSAARSEAQAREDEEYRKTRGAIYLTSQQPARTVTVDTGFLY